MSKNRDRNPHMNAMRFALPPLPQPTYSFGDIPRISSKELKGCEVQYVTDRQGFQQCMGEMLLVCKEAARRRRQRFPDLPKEERSGSKPLSLEYLADRLDVDEPLWGYLVRHEGRLAGFVCVTTFTNYEKSFFWDSTNEVAFSGDDEAEKKSRISGNRKVDTSGNLSSQLQATVRCGDVWQEGIVWPHIAEISLLGGLGCGRTLVDLVLEDLARMKATQQANYDYVVLQATNNSISFYESLGFVRVGAISERDDKGDYNESKAKKEAPPSPRGSHSPEQSFPQSGGDAGSGRYECTSCPENIPDNIVMSQIFLYQVKKPGEQLAAIAKKFKVDVYDLLFLNETKYSDLTPSSRLILGTVLYVPDKQQGNRANSHNNVTNPWSASDIKWHTAKENDTPRTIAKMYKLDSEDIVRANKYRLKGLQSRSRLRQGTQVRVSHLNAPDVEHGYIPYSHWAFPDDDHFDEGEPSYMMALPIKRARGAAAKSRPVRERLESHIGHYRPTDAIVHVPKMFQETAAGSSRKPLLSQLSSKSESPTGFELYAKELRTNKAQLFIAASEAQADKIIREAWANLDLELKISYTRQSAQLRLEHNHAIYKGERSDSTNAWAEDGAERARISPGEVNSGENFYNMVVRVKPGVADKVDVDTQEFQYWYVLTFIPDLRWCHLAPMIQDGTFGPEKGKANGRPRWKLVSEDLGKELDISSSLCEPVKSRSVKKTTDADKEEWDIIDEEDKPSFKRRATPGSTRATPVSAVDAPTLLATVPGEDQDIRVKLKGACTKNLEGSAKRARGSSSASRKRNYSDSLALVSGGNGLHLVAVRPDGKEISVKLSGASVSDCAPSCPKQQPKKLKAARRQLVDRFDSQSIEKSAPLGVAQLTKKQTQGNSVLPGLSPKKFTAGTGNREGGKLSRSMIVCCL